MPVELGASTFALRSVTRKDRSLGGSGVPLRFREDRHAGPARYLFFLDTLRKKPHSSLLAKISKLRVLKAEEINSLQPVRASDGTLEVVSEYLACHGHPRSSRIDGIREAVVLLSLFLLKTTGVSGWCPGPLLLHAR